MSLGGILGGFLSGDAGNPERDGGTNARAVPEALAVALASDQIKADPRLARATEVFLEEQTLLLREQRDEIAESRGLRLAQLHGQMRESRMRYAAQRIRVLAQCLVLLILVVIGSGVGAMIYSACTSHSVVVNTFEAPSALAPRGVNGAVVAAKVLDALQKLQAATRTATAALDTRGAWANDIQIEVPRTGVSIGEVSRLLHERLGHDVHIDGDLTEDAFGALSLTVRGGDIPAATFNGGPADLTALVMRAAEYVYGRFQPWRYSAYLLDAGRDRDAVAFLPGALSRARDDKERANLLNIWGGAFYALGDGFAAAGKYRLARALATPWSRLWWTAGDNLIGAIMVSEGEEAAWREGVAARKAVDDAPGRERPDVRVLVNEAQVTWDLPLLLQSLSANLPRQEGTVTSPVAPLIAEVDALLHDPEQSALFIAMSDPADIVTQAETLMLKGEGALARDDVAAAIAPLQAFDRDWLADRLIQATEPDQACVLGLAYGLAGDLPEADRAFGQVTEPWSRCYAFRGEVLAHAGDAEGARRVWAEGVRLLPDLPNVYLARGRWELAQGDLNAASTDLSTASAKAPHFADPLKAWGDLLAREGLWKEAVEKYDAALKNAPGWAELRQARAAAVASERAGHPAE